MLDFNVIHNATLYKVPYRWAFIQNLLTKEDSLALAKTYPKYQSQEINWEGNNGFFWQRPTIMTPKELAQMRELNENLHQKIAQGEISCEVQNLNNFWRKFIEELQSSAFREAMSKMLGVDLRKHFMGIQFCRSVPGHFGRPPHNDFSPSTKGTYVTQLFFFNQEWHPNWGGYLRILANEKPESVIHEIPPLINTSVALVFSENSWHMVTPIAANAPHHRLVLLITYSTGV